MSDFVEIIHPDVAGIAKVPASTLGIHARHGWVRNDPAVPVPVLGDTDTPPPAEGDNPSEED